MVAERYCIVGAGPCGLLAARALRRAGIAYDHYERHSDVGGIWDIDSPGTPMYESAHFISSRFKSSFYGYPMPDSFPDYPGHRHLLEYIRGFAETFDLKRPIRFGQTVERATPIGEGAQGGWQVTLGSGEQHSYRGIIAAPGVTWLPSEPDYPGLETFAGEVLHSVAYRDPALFRGKRVLIVGAGNSGVDIACDAATNAVSAAISLRRGYHFFPKHIFGVPLDMAGTDMLRLPEGTALPEDFGEMLSLLVGDLTRYGLPAPDHPPFASHPIMNTQILHHLAHGDIVAKGAVTSFDRGGAVFADGSRLDLDAVLFATGYECRVPFIDDALFDWNGTRPDLYLNIFHRQLEGLAVVGFVEFASAGYQRFDDMAAMAAMAAMDAALRAQGGEAYAQWRALVRDDRPDLRAGHAYIASDRHANYVEVTAYRDTLKDLRQRFGWPDPNDALFAPMGQAITQGETHD